TPSFRGRTAMMLSGVRPIMRRASSPTASSRLVSFSTATTDGSRRTMPFPRTKMSTLAVPKSIPISRPNKRAAPLGPNRPWQSPEGYGKIFDELEGFPALAARLPGAGPGPLRLRRRPEALRCALAVAPVLAPRGLAAADVALRLVQIEDALHLAGQVLADARKPLRDVFVHRALAHADNGGGLTHRRFGLDDVVADVDHPFPDVVPHRSAPPARCWYNIWPADGVYVSGPGEERLHDAVFPVTALRAPPARPTAARPCRGGTLPSSRIVRWDIGR